MSRKNILAITLDQVAWSDFGYAGGQICRTPNIDALAAQSVNFANAYTVCPVCAPTRGTFVTGQFPHSHGIIANPEELPGGRDLDVRDDQYHIGTMLGNAGYNLGFAGKYHVAQKLPRDYGFQGMSVPGHGSGGFASGANQFDDCLEYRDYLKARELKKGRLLDPKLAGTTVIGGKIEGPEEATVPYMLAETTNDLLDSFADDYKDSGKPFFMSLNFWGPHPPCYSPEPYCSMYEDADIQPWPTFTDDMAGKPAIHRLECEGRDMTWEDFRKILVYYYGFLTFIDVQIGRVLERLSSLGLDDSTVILLTSDHGGFIGHHGGQLNKGYRMYEECIRTPMLIRPPGAKESRRVEGFASNGDYYPTILDFAGIEIPENRHGQSLRPIAEDPVATHSGQDSVVTEFHALCGVLFTQRALMYKQYKYVFNVADKDEFYDLQADPNEMTNAIETADPDLLKEMRFLLLEHMERTKDKAQNTLRSRYDLHKTPPAIKCYGFDVVYEEQKTE